MTKVAKKFAQKSKRHFRIRKKLSGTRLIPRLVVFRSNKYIYAQVIDDKEGKTIASVSTRNLKNDKSKNVKKIDSSFASGKNLAKSLEAKKIKKIIFDRGGYKYHGRVKALAEGARSGGLDF
ncbi:50S ribosomal protein L18 [Candidatus Curtissbacteria bacterium]|nr:50S ribosomal protein L18 [Candidatus Curtissbacteria bacterium]